MSELLTRVTGKVERLNDGFLKLADPDPFGGDCLLKEDNLVVGAVGSLQPVLDVLKTVDEAVDLLLEVALLLLEGSQLLLLVEVRG